MKLFVIILCLGFLVNANAQEYYTKEVVETDVFDSTKVSALRYRVSIIDQESFQKLWKKEMLQRSEEKVEVDEYITKMSGVVIPSISKEPFTAYVKAKPAEGGLELLFAMKDSTGFIDMNTTPHRSEIETYFEESVRTAYINKLSEKLKEESHTLDMIDSDIKKSYKEISKNDKLILKLESEIENTKKQIEIHESQYDVLLTAIEESKTELATTSKDDVNYKEIKKEVKNLEKNKKNMENEHLSNKELVYDDEAKIVQTKDAIKALEEAIANLQEKKWEQKKLILALEEEVYRLNTP